MISKEDINNHKGSILHPVTPQDIGLDSSSDLDKRVGSLLFSTWIRVLMQNWRQGTVASRGRGDVNRTNKKPWKQKGTGRARAGSARSPLWKGGGVIFGPQPRVRTLKMTKKSKQQVMRILVEKFFESKNIVCVDRELEGDVPKSSAAQKLLSSIGIAGKKIVIFGVPCDFKLALSFANIPGVCVLEFDQANAYTLANSDCWLFFKKDLEEFKRMVSQWL